MLNLKLDEAKNKIGENPVALDRVELPQIKQQQDIEVKISKIIHLKNNADYSRFMSFKSYLA
jgi:hypothetical protein